MTRILIAEDEERIVSFLEKGLRAAGYATVGVSTGPDALALARDDSFDLVVLDLGLPGIDGHEVLRRLRARGERLPVVVLTARSGIDDTVGALDLAPPRERFCPHRVRLDLGASFLHPPHLRRDRVARPGLGFTACDFGVLLAELGLGDELRFFDLPANFGFAERLRLARFGFGTLHLRAPFAHDEMARDPSFFDLP